MRTLEGDKIKRLIAEFVDIILKKRQIVDPFGLEGDEGAIMIEDYVLRARSVPLSMVDVQNRLGSPLVEEEQYEVVPPQVPQQQPQQMPFEPRGPFGPLADLLPAEVGERVFPWKKAHRAVPFEQTVHFLANSSRRHRHNSQFHQLRRDHLKCHYSTNNM